MFHDSYSLEHKNLEFIFFDNHKVITKTWSRDPVCTKSIDMKKGIGLLSFLAPIINWPSSLSQITGDQSFTTILQQSIII